jgi:putative phosphoesterase
MIGIMADSHDNVNAVRRAVRFFNDTECGLVIHAGDIVAPFSARELGNLSCQVKAVFGNCDGEKEGLKKSFEGFGEIKEAPFIFSQNRQRFLITHVHFSVPHYAASGEHDVLIFGHTHKPEIRREEGTLLINPGETGGWLSGRHTVVLLNPETLETELVVL